MDYSFIFYLVAALLVLTGIAGIILPALPGIPLVFAGLLVAAWADGFAHVGWVPLTLLGILTLLSFAVDILATVVGAQRVGASRKALWGTVLGSIAGLFFMPIGLLAGPLLGALAASTGIPANWAARPRWALPPGWASCSGWH